MGGDHRCYGCEAYVGTQHRLDCRYGHRSGPTVLPEDAVHDPTLGMPARGVIGLTAEETLWAWWGMEALAREGELRPHEERFRERLRVMLGASAEDRPPVGA